MENTYTVLMYHATPARIAGCSFADPHYAVAETNFVQQLDLLAALGLSAKSAESVTQTDRAVAITFDDGHETNQWAAEMLASRGWSGTFFVNPASVGTQGFLSWSALRDMASAGMSIQSHSQNHVYHDDLPVAAQLQELFNSKRAIEDKIGGVVETFAPPGGRVSKDSMNLAKQAGYTSMCTSRVGLWRTSLNSNWDIPRFAVLASTPLTRFGAWVRQSPAEIYWQIARYKSLRTAKDLLGNAGYERLRHRWLSHSREL